MKIPGAVNAGDDLAARYKRVRGATAALCDGLQPEDMVAQSMPQASPAKWHLAHTTWFFEQFVLGLDRGYRPLQPSWSVLFNSYYQSVGPQHAREQRGQLSRPTVAEIRHYREQIDERILDLLAHGGDEPVRSVIELGLNHEQQHQELLLTDLQHLFSVNPLAPAYRAPASAPAREPVVLKFIAGHEGPAEIGHAGAAFAFDNESPRHRVWLQPHALANRPVNNAEFREFVLDGGYCKPSLWLSVGWSMVQAQNWQRPLYWDEDLARAFTLGGRRPLEPLAPVCHVSFFEADAFARWAGARLPTEVEWESAASSIRPSGNFQESTALRPLPPSANEGLLQLFGDVWEWTSSPYVSYPGFRQLPGSLGEYNGKFMCGQWVLRGGSCATPADHIRASYRNFFYPQDRWQFAGLRLAKDK